MSGKIYFGQEALDKTELQKNWPISNGFICDWKTLEKILQHIFSNELKLDPSQHVVLVTETTRNTKS